MDVSDRLIEGREAFRRRAWGEAYQCLSSLDQAGALPLADLELLAMTAFLTGRVDESGAVWTRAHQQYLNSGDKRAAVRCGFWHGFERAQMGDFAQAGGWLARCQRLLEEGQLDCAECGYVLIPIALQTFESADNEASLPIFEQIRAIGDRFGDKTLITVGDLGRGHIWIRHGAIEAGLRLLDELMVSVTAGDVSPMMTGLCYCAVIGIYHELFDLRRAQEWTEALTRMCEAEADLVPYRGECLAHRAEIMQMHGAWPQAMGEVRMACERLSNPPGQVAAGPAYYQQAELYRLQGQFQRAEESYRVASQYGHSPHPGLALLRLAQGQIDAAEAAIRREALSAGDVGARARLLAAFVEIMLAIGDAEAARLAVDELAQIAATLNAPMLHAAWKQADGAVHLIEGKPQLAIESLQHAWTNWQALEIPYEAARVRALIGRCCRELGDEDTAQMEFDAAAWVLRQLGAEPELARVEALRRRAPARPIGALTAREVEVLRQVAAGKTNRAIAAELFLSEKTVARHMSNIFAKLGISSRSAATAYAFEHELV
jgi:DNA-binding CsgD family transcriptional regulator